MILIVGTLVADENLSCTFQTYIFSNRYCWNQETQHTFASIASDYDDFLFLFLKTRVPYSRQWLKESMCQFYITNVIRVYFYSIIICDTEEFVLFFQKWSCSLILLVEYKKVGFIYHYDNDFVTLFLSDFLSWCFLNTNGTLHYGCITYGYHFHVKHTQTALPP